MLHLEVETMKRTTATMMACLRLKFTSKFTKSEASTMPKKLAEIADQKGMPSTEVIIGPAHAPVPGKGTATNNLNLSH